MAKPDNEVEETLVGPFMKLSVDPDSPPEKPAPAPPSPLRPGGSGSHRLARLNVRNLNFVFASVVFVSVVTRAN